MTDVLCHERITTPVRWPKFTWAAISAIFYADRLETGKRKISCPLNLYK